MDEKIELIVNILIIPRFLKVKETFFPPIFKNLINFSGGQHDRQLKNKTVLITGSSRGLGYVTALALAREGCRVAINSRDEAKVSAAAKNIAGETGAQVIGMAGDVADPDVPERLVSQFARAFGGLRYPHY